MAPSPSVLFPLLVSPKTPHQTWKENPNQPVNQCGAQLFCFLSLSLFLFFSCGSKVKTDVGSDESGRGKQAHGEMRGDGEPSPHLQVVQRWQRAEEKQKSPNKEQPVSTSHPCLVNLTTVRDEKERRCSWAKATLLLAADTAQAPF